MARRCEDHDPLVSVLGIFVPPIGIIEFAVAALAESDPKTRTLLAMMTLLVVLLSVVHYVCSGRYLLRGLKETVARFRAHSERP